MARLSLSSSLLLLCLCAAASFSAGSSAPLGSAILATAINRANVLGKACNNTLGCYGKRITVTLNSSVVLDAALPQLTNNAHLMVIGNCSGIGGCVIDGGNKFGVFSFAMITPAQLRLDRLTFQNCLGVLSGFLQVYTIATNIIFSKNVQPISSSANPPGGFPLQEFQNCTFVSNTGSAISLGNEKYGLASNGTGLRIKNSLFLKNTNTGNGGAVSLAGAGVAIFVRVVFDSNSATGSGGAVYANQATTVSFVDAVFTGNKAAQGGGGAVAGTSGFYDPLALGFCKCQFIRNNTASGYHGSDQLFFQAQQGSGGALQTVTVSFCNTQQPYGSVFPPKPAGIINSGAGKPCFSQYCPE